MANFQKAIDHVLVLEGGMVFHPMDHGGPTNFGITLELLRDFKKDPSLGPDAIKGLDRSEAIDIYRKVFWDPLKLWQITSDKIALLIFDQVVNRGPKTVIKQLQKCLSLTEDGIIGPKTIMRINLTQESKLFFDLFIECQNSYLKIAIADPNQMVFLRGWMNRTHAILRAI